MSTAARPRRRRRERMMLSQIATLAAEVAVICEVLFGAVLLLAWAAFELIGYGGLLFSVARRRGWFTLFAAAKPRRDIRWGIAIRAEGLRSRRLQHGEPQAA
jgi:hypothetical protein